MNIKTKLSIQFTLLVAVILLFFSVLLYFFSIANQRNRFQDNLIRRARNTAILLTSVEEIDSLLLQKIYRSTRSWEKEEIVVVDSMMNEIYVNNRNYLTPRYVSLLISTGESTHTSIHEKDVVVYKYNSGTARLYVVVAAYDLARSIRLKRLRQEMLWSSFVSILLAIFTSYFFSRKAMGPISDMITSIREINAAKLGKRLDEGRQKDEIEQLAMAFNNMISNLESAFRSQEEFVANASHELRTPLTVMISESDYLLNNQQSHEELVSHLKKMIEDLKDLNYKTNSLLELANLNKNNIIDLSDVRIDEIVHNSIRKVRTKFPDRKIVSRVDYSDNENDMMITGNAGLLEIAVKNLIDNACKFSGNEINVEIQNKSDFINVRISDHGIGIPDDELNSISLPFKRGSNARFISGIGIGLTLVTRIMEVHNADFSISSSTDTGTAVELLFRKKG